MVDLKLLWRDWRGGQLNLILTSLILAVLVVTSVSLLSDRVEKGLNDQVSSFLAADLAVQGGIEIPDNTYKAAQNFDLQTARTASFRSMVFAGIVNDDSVGKNHLAAIKAVENNYPLRGRVSIASDNRNDAIQVLSSGPESGEIWVEPRLLNLLDIQLGDFIEIGYSQLKVTQLLVKTPDQGTGFSFAGARILMSYSDLEKTQLIRPGSRINHRLLLAGSPQQISAFSEWFSKNKETNSEASSHHRLLTPERTEQRLSDALERGRGFLLLSGTIGVLLAGLAMALASHRYASRLTDQVALMKAWGLNSNQIRRSHLFRLFVIALIATSIGLFLGWLAHYMLLEVIKVFFSAQLPSPGWRPWVVASLTGMVCVIGFALPALWHLPSIAPLKVLRRDLPDGLISQTKRLCIGVGALVALVIWYSGDIVIAMLFLAVLLILFALSALIAMQALKLVLRFGQWQGSFVRLGLSNLWRRRSLTLVQLVGFSTTLMLLLIVLGVRTNLIAEWQAQLPEDAPSHFIFNVTNNELPTIKGLLAERDINTGKWYPMVRGRLVSHNAVPLTAEALSKTDGLAREVNFTQSRTMPEDNQLVAGQWWGDQSSVTDNQFSSQFSMEQDVADSLGAKVGDQFEFSIGGLKLAATLTSIRKVDWQNMTPNFFVIFNQGVLDRFSPNWITNVTDQNATSLESQNELGSAQIYQTDSFVNQLSRSFPTIVVIELNALIKQIRDVITRITLGLEMILFLVLVCGALVLFAAIGASFGERLRENAVLRTLGSSRKLIIGAMLTEFMALGAIAGVIAAFGAEVILYLLQTFVFKMQAAIHPELWFYGLVGGIVMITLLGFLRTREVITVPPLQSLRQVNI